MAVYLFCRTIMILHYEIDPCPIGIISSFFLLYIPSSKKRSLVKEVSLVTLQLLCALSK